MKRLTAMLLMLVFALTCCLSVTAATGGSVMPQASLTISKTSVGSYTGDNTGEVDFDYSISPTRVADQLGVSSIVIHKPDGTTYTVTGTVSNGLIGSGNIHAGTYTYKGISGKSYYAEITLFSTIGSNSDSRTVTTRSATAR